MVKEWVSVMVCKHENNDTSKVDARDVSVGMVNKTKVNDPDALDSEDAQCDPIVTVIYLTGSSTKSQRRQGLRHIS